MYLSRESVSGESREGIAFWGVVSGAAGVSGVVVHSTDISLWGVFELFGKLYWRRYKMKKIIRYN